MGLFPASTHAQAHFARDFLSSLVEAVAGFFYNLGDRKKDFLYGNERRFGESPLPGRHGKH